MLAAVVLVTTPMLASVVEAAVDAFCPILLVVVPVLAPLMLPIVTVDALELPPIPLPIFTREVMAVVLLSPIFIVGADAMDSAILTVVSEIVVVEAPCPSVSV